MSTKKQAIYVHDSIQFSKQPYEVGATGITNLHTLKTGITYSHVSNINAGPITALRSAVIYLRSLNSQKTGVGLGLGLPDSRAFFPLLHTLHSMLMTGFLS